MSEDLSDVPSVFVLMPFEDGFTDVYTQLVKGPLEGIGFVVRRADSLFNQQQILKDIVKGIVDATLIVADVTGLNENVLYELGLAHALGKRVVMITQAISELPFDLRAYRANEYSTDFTRASELKVLLRGIGEAVLRGEADFSNPVQDFAPEALAPASQVSLGMGPAKPATSGAVDGSEPPQEPEREDDDAGWLELVFEMQGGTQDAVAAMTEIGELAAAIGTKLSAHTDRLNRARDNLGGGSLGARLVIAREAAQDVNDFADEVEQRTERLAQALQKTTTGANALAREGQINSDEDASAIESLIHSIDEGAIGMKTGRESIESFARQMIDTPNFERTYNRATKRAGSVVTRTAQVIQDAESELTRAREIMRERLEDYRAERVSPEDEGAPEV